MGALKEFYKWVIDAQRVKCFEWEKMVDKEFNASVLFLINIHRSFLFIGF